MRTAAKLSALFCLLLLACLATLVGCAGKGATSDEDLVDVSLPELRAHLADPDTKAILLDVRPADAYRDGHIRGAVSAPITTLQRGDIRLAEQDYIVVYGDDYQDVLAPAAAKKLQAFGYEDVLLFRGGLADWQKAGGPTQNLR